MKYPKTLHLSIFLAIAAVLTTGSAYGEEQISYQSPSEPSASMVTSHRDGQTVNQAELDAFFGSEYTYWDAAQLATYWGQNLDEAKARIGRKIRWGPADVAILKQFLLDARLESLQSVNELNFYVESSYNYDDAAALAEFWGEPSPFDAKLRIERNLILGNADEVETALQLATPSP